MLEIISAVDMTDKNGISPFGQKEKLLLFRTIINEDNSTALKLVNSQKVTSRTKHWNIKFHFFWSHINDEAKNIQVVKVDTKFQQANYLTKGLTRELFENYHRLNQGW